MRSLAATIARRMKTDSQLAERAALLAKADLVTTMVGGYAAFLLIVLVFHAWIADEPNALPSALWGGAFLCGVILVLAAGSALLDRRRGTAG